MLTRCDHHKLLKKIILINKFILVNGGLSPWQPWGDCSRECGGGIRMRNRTCTNPSPQYGGSDCNDNDTDQRKCNTHDCSPIDGNWSSWLSWSVCTATCGGGTQVRVRSCTNPVPQWGGAACQGESDDLQTCSEEKCPPGNCKSLVGLIN